MNNQFNSTMSKQEILSRLAEEGATWGTADFWDCYWRITKDISPDEAIEIAGKLNNWANDKNSPAYSERAFEEKTARQRNTSLNAPICSDKALTLSDVIKDRANKQFNVEKLIYKALRAGATEQQAHIWGLYEAGYNQVEIAQETGIKQQRISEILTATRELIRNHINEKEPWYWAYLDSTSIITKSHLPAHNPLPKALQAARELIEELSWETCFDFDESGKIRNNLICTSPQKQSFTLTQSSVVNLAQSIRNADKLAEFDWMIDVCISEHQNGHDSVIVKFQSPEGIKGYLTAGQLERLVRNGELKTTNNKPNKKYHIIFCNYSGKTAQSHT